MIEKFTSIREVIGKVYRDLSLEDESKWMDMVEWSAEALEQIGAYPQYVHKAVELEVEKFRLAIPCDFHKIIGMEHCGAALVKLTGNFDTAQRTDYQEERLRSRSARGYLMNEGWFNFNFEEGTVNLAYIAVPTDEEGFPLIPDNISFKEAIVKYIVMKLNYSKFVTDTINPNTWDRIVNDWHYYCSQARGKANMPTADQLESIKNMWNRLKPMMNEHRVMFNKLGNVERITRA
jgi:hypothetical protein